MKSSAEQVSPRTTQREEGTSRGTGGQLAGMSYADQVAALSPVQRQLSGSGGVQGQPVQLTEDQHRQTGTSPTWGGGTIGTYEVCEPDAEDPECFGSEDDRYAEAEHQQSWAFLSPLSDVGLEVEHEKVEGEHRYWFVRWPDQVLNDEQFQDVARGYLAGVATRYEDMDDGELIAFIGELGSEYIQWVTDTYRVFDWWDQPVHVDDPVPEPDMGRLVMEAYIDAAQSASGFVGPAATAMSWFCLGMAAVATGGLALGGAIPSAGIAGAGLTFDSGMALANTTLRVIGIAAFDGWDFGFSPGNQTSHQTTVLTRAVTSESTLHRFFNENHASVPWTVRMKVLEIAQRGFE